MFLIDTIIIKDHIIIIDTIIIHHREDKHQYSAVANQCVDVKKKINKNLEFTKKIYIFAMNVGKQQNK
jgi:hypothetical protein